MKRIEIKVKSLVWEECSFGVSANGFGLFFYISPVVFIDERGIPRIKSVLSCDGKDMDFINIEEAIDKAEQINAEQIIKEVRSMKYIDNYLEGSK